MTVSKWAREPDAIGNWHNDSPSASPQQTSFQRWNPLEHGKVCKQTQDELKADKKLSHRCNVQYCDQLFQLTGGSK